PWDAAAQHGGGPAALIARAIEGLEAPAPMLLARLSIEFLGAVPMAPVAVHAEIVRSGRRLQLAEATLEAEGRVVCRAHAVLLRREPVAVPAGAVPAARLAPPDGLVAEQVPLPPHGEAEGFARTGMELRFASGRFAEPGRATAWFRLTMPLVEGEEPSPVQRAIAAADFGNGVAAELPFATHLFVNTELTVHLSRMPVGEWIAVEGVTEHGPEGTALAASTLHDSSGPIGRGAQALYVATR
ncbi:MAG: hypothetical protein QOG68_2495, partial [Solirubrobacteraceae bacterium]|nr:hypothetical protein [Solirubrobacteraceae bacterium]